VSGSGGDEPRVIVRNRRAFRDYHVVEQIEAGVALLGPEVKSIRAGKASIAEAYASFRGEELFLVDMHVPEYDFKGYAPHEPRRPRKLLLKKRELRELKAAVERKGFTLVPLQMHFTRGRVKVKLGLAKGRKRHDKRDLEREKEARKEARAAEGRRR